MRTGVLSFTGPGGGPGCQEQGGCLWVGSGTLSGFWNPSGGLRSSTLSSFLTRHSVSLCLPLSLMSGSGLCE